jgi:biotin carboxyl carrier protein
VKFQFEIADRLRSVEVLRDPSGFRVTVDGRARLVDAVRVDAGTWSLVVRDADAAGARARSVEAVVVPSAMAGGFDVYVDGYHVPVQPRDGHGRRARAAGGSSGAGPQRVTAPMPGKVVRVLVAPGDAVKARQGLVVVEAMKMENELRAARDGRVREVFVAEGQSVDAGAALVVVE